MSNYDYLIYLNIMGSRSFSDLSQYPVFPWIITNFEDEEDFDIDEVKNYRELSKPIGALNPEKLEQFSKKYWDMKMNNSTAEIAFYYGTHYSNPAYVIYYLTRAFPQFQLQIQNGSFGPPDRMFNSIKDCWYYTYSFGNDVKELIPEFYNSDGEFLLNIHNIQLGKNKSNNTINDVTLPTWAKSVKDFINIFRAALESEYVSSSINHWIDLIFGYKQRNEEAGISENLFWHKTYDSYNYEDQSEIKKAADITQILQFGQTPRQLFLEPHPKKRSLDILNYQLLSNPKEMILTIEKYKRENEKLENNYKKMEHTKFLEKEKLIREYKEIDKLRGERVKNLKE
jgi:factor associated with neutral sphingomyelinase activation